MNAAVDICFLLYNIAYLFEKTPYYRPWLSWIGVDIRRLGIDDLVSWRDMAALHSLLTIPQRAMQKSSQRSSINPPKGPLATIRRMLWSSPRMLLDSLKILLPTAIFFVKFLEWWYSPSSPARALTISPLGPSIPPPQMLPPHPQGINVDSTKYGVCPLCKKALANATALPSGYVFCYRCVYDYTQKHGQCPVTLQPVRVWQLRKVLV